MGLLHFVPSCPYVRTHHFYYSFIEKQRKGNISMNTKNSLIEEKELLELMDIELESVCGGGSFHSSPFSNNFNNSYIRTGAVNQSASGSAIFGDSNTIMMTSYGSAGPVTIGSVVATNINNESIGYFPG
jgi:hypothetical protein